VLTISALPRCVFFRRPEGTRLKNPSGQLFKLTISALPRFVTF
jgi:hypothetical protein